MQLELKHALAFTDTLATLDTPNPQKQSLLRGFHGCPVSIEPSYSIEWKRGVERNGNGKREDVL